MFQTGGVEVFYSESGVVRGNCLNCFAVSFLLQIGGHCGLCLGSGTHIGTETKNLVRLRNPQM